VSGKNRILAIKCHGSVIGVPPDKPEITNYKHQMTNKFQITISKSQKRSKANGLEF
jgi:hypothetical protein